MITSTFYGQDIWCESHAMIHSIGKLELDCLVFVGTLTFRKLANGWKFRRCKSHRLRDMIDRIRKFSPPNAALGDSIPLWKQNKDNFIYRKL